MTDDSQDKFDEVENWIDFDEVKMDFLETAELKIAVEASTHLSQQAVWNAFDDPSTWRHWFPKVETAFYLGIKPYGVGTTRRSIVDGIFYDETLLVLEEPRRWGYRIDRATSAIAKAQLEITEFRALEFGTQVIWTLALDPLFEIEEAAFSEFLKALLEEAIGQLEAFSHRTEST